MITTSHDTTNVDRGGDVVKVTLDVAGKATDLGLELGAVGRTKLTTSMAERQGFDDRYFGQVLARARITLNIMGLLRLSSVKLG